MSKTPTFLVAGAIWLTCSSVQAFSSALDPLNDALALLQTDPAAAVAALEPLSAAGDVEATASLATALEIAGADPERSERLWAQALAGGSQNARLNLGMRRLLNDIDTDDEEAFAMLEGLSEPQKSFAAYPMGRAYLLGRGVKQDLAQGSRLMATAVKNDPGNTDAQFLLGRTYRNGWGVPVDAKAAFEHFRIAADAGDARAQWNLGMMLLSGEGVSANPSLAYRYVRNSAEQEHKDGMISLAVMLALGQGVTPNPAEARVWYERAARAGSAHALRGLGMMSFVGQGGPSDPIMGAAYVEMAAEAGDANAAIMLQRYAEPISKLDRRSINATKAKWIEAYGRPQ